MTSEVKQEAEQFEYKCSFCSDPAELTCGNCEEVYYCRSEHQKLDWKRHSSNCISLADKRLMHLSRWKSFQRQLFNQLARQSKEYERLQLLKTMLDQQAKFMQKVPQEVELEVQYGATICARVRLMKQSQTQFGNAQKELREYLEAKNVFLSDIKNIYSLEQLQEKPQSERKRCLQLINMKMRLLFTVTNLTQLLFMNVISFLEIICDHYVKIYGPDSLEVSNIYFYSGNYCQNILKNINYLKIMAFFLKAAKIRKEKGGTALFNVGIILFKNGKMKKAAEYFTKALELIEKQRNPPNSYIVPQIYQQLALVHKGSNRLMMDNLEKAYFYYIKTDNKERANHIMRFFMQIRYEARVEGSDELKGIKFQKQKKEKRPKAVFSNKNLKNYQNAEKGSEQNQNRQKEWIESFKDAPIKNDQISIVKAPKELEYLFGNENKHDNDDETPLNNINAVQNQGLGQTVNVDQQLIRILDANQLGHLHQLNRLLMECRERAALIDIVQNSNFIASVGHAKKQKFYQLNPKLRKQQNSFRGVALRKIDEEEEEEEEESLEMQEKPIIPKLDIARARQI